MSNDFFHKLKLQFSRIRIADPDFGEMTFMFVFKAPEKSYWEGKWTIPNSGKAIEAELYGVRHHLTLIEGTALGQGD